MTKARKRQSNPQRLANGPAHKPVHPWVWSVGDEVHALQHSRPLKVVGGELWMGCPHLHLIDHQGQVWRVPQLHTSSKALEG